MHMYLSSGVVVFLKHAHLVVKHAALERMVPPHNAMLDSVMQDMQKPLTEHAKVSDHHLINYVPTIWQCGLVNSRFMNRSA